MGERIERSDPPAGDISLCPEHGALMVYTPVSDGKVCPVCLDAYRRSLEKEVKWDGTDWA